MRGSDELWWLGMVLLVLGIVGSCGELVRRGGRAEACVAACGDDWKWADRCVCLSEVPSE